jgi:hypothetical protein
MELRQRDMLDSLRNRFIEWLGALNFSPKTRINYSRDIRLFLNWLLENTDVSRATDITPAHLRHYQVEQALRRPQLFLMARS